MIFLVSSSVLAQSPTASNAPIPPYIASAIADPARPQD
jgi:hypothetical protein